MRCRIAAIIFLLCTVCMNLNAKFLQEIELNDGSIIVGYVYKQIPGKSMVIHVAKTTKGNIHNRFQPDEKYNIAWSKVKAIRASVESSIPWCYDKLTTINKKTYIGNITAQVLGSTIQIKTKDGKVVKLKSSEVVKSEKIAKDIDHDLWIDRQYTNRIRLNDNTVFNGLIVLQYRGRKAEDGYIELLQKNGSTIKIYQQDVKEYTVILM